MLKPPYLSLALALSLIGVGCVSKEAPGECHDPTKAGCVSNEPPGECHDPTKAGCVSNTPPEECHDPAKVGCVVTSDKPRVANTWIGEGDGKALVDGNTDFALDLYARLRTAPGNLFYSPYSISTALAMTYAGARGDTEAEIAKTLKFTLPQDKLHPTLNALDQALASRGEGAMGSDGGKFRLNVVNAVWGQTGKVFEIPFLDVLATNYGAGMRVLDYQKAPDESRVIINDWVAERTEGKVKDLLVPGDITSLTQLVLTNAIYFNASWLTPFNSMQTAPGNFTKKDGGTVTVSMMANKFLETAYGEGEGYAALELPYDGRALSMVLVLPTDIDAFESGLDRAKLEGITSSVGHRLVDVTLPHFKFESRFSVADTLKAMGMPTAFNGEANFSGIDGERDLSISDVIHKAFVSINEAGTEAAASTAVIFGGSASGAPQSAAIHFDHPFLFFIRDLSTGAILFFGRVSDPTS